MRLGRRAKRGGERRGQERWEQIRTEKERRIRRVEIMKKRGDEGKAEEMRNENREEERV